MLTGAIIGAGIGIGVALISILFRKPRECPECGERLRTPWIRPLEECPHCGELLVNRRGSSANRDSLLSSRKALVTSLVLILIGLVVLVGFLIPALESRRVWRHQERQIDLREAEIHDLARRDDPASRARANEFRADLRGMQPEAHREEFVQRAALAGLGGMAAIVGLVLAALHVTARRAAAETYDDEEDFDDDERET